MKTNKLRNAFLIAGFCLFNTFSYAQTKEETIGWLKEKLGSYMYLDDAEFQNQKVNDLKITSFNECEFTLTFELKTVNTGEVELMKTVAPCNGILINLSSGNIYYKNSVAKWIDSSGGLLFRWQLPFVKIGLNEENIIERIKKAFDHLATFCPKKKETF